MIVDLHSLAEEELFEVAQWYELQCLGLGDELMAEVDQWLAVIAETPDMWPEWNGAPKLDPPIRHAILQRFPFSIAYQHFSERVVVLAVAHASRRPFYWRKRS